MNIRKYGTCIIFYLKKCLRNLKISTWSLFFDDFKNIVTFPSPLVIRKNPNTANCFYFDNLMDLKL